VRKNKKKISAVPLESYEKLEKKLTSVTFDPMF